MSGWDKVIDNESHVWRMYLAEINRQARTCKAACGHVLELGDRLRMSQHFSPSDGEDLGEHVEQAISCAASLRNLIFGNGQKPKSKELAPFRADRIAWIQNLLGNPSLPTIENVAARNSLEHFDERMDSWAYEWAHRTEDESGWVGAFDCIVKSRDSWAIPEVHTAFVRCYIADETVFVVRDDEVHIPTLMKEANAVIQPSRRFVAEHTAMWKKSGAAPQIIVPL